jgi:hypothetical protein
MDYENPQTSVIVADFRSEILTWDLRNVSTDHSTHDVRWRHITNLSVPGISIRFHEHGRIALYIIKIYSHYTAPRICVRIRL